MASIIRGTTPTLKYTFNRIHISDIVAAYLSIKSNEDIEKSLADATIGEDYISWTLSQEETLSFGDNVKVMVNWLLSDGTRGASEKTSIRVDDNYHKEEMRHE